MGPVKHPEETEDILHLLPFILLSTNTGFKLNSVTDTFYSCSSTLSYKCNLGDFHCVKHLP